MTTAEKRAQLEAEGVSWPDCECHGEPSGWGVDPRYKAGGFFRCAVAQRIAVRERYELRREAGVCTRCGEPPVTESLCAEHAEALAEANRRYEQQPYRRMMKASHNMRYRAQQRAVEGFRPTGVGLAAFAAWNKGKDQ